MRIGLSRSAPKIQHLNRQMEPYTYVESHRTWKDSVQTHLCLAGLTELVPDRHIENWEELKKNNGSIYLIYWDTHIHPSALSPLKFNENYEITSYKYGNSTIQCAIAHKTWRLYIQIWAHTIMYDLMQVFKTASALTNTHPPMKLYDDSKY